MLLGYGRAQATTPTEQSRGGTSEIASGRTRKIALVAQRIEHWPPAPGVAGSIPAEGANVTVLETIDADRGFSVIVDAVRACP